MNNSLYKPILEKSRVNYFFSLKVQRSHESRNLPEGNLIANLDSIELATSEEPNLLKILVTLNQHKERRALKGWCS